MVILVAFENEGLRTPVPLSMPSIPSSSVLSNDTSCCLFSSPGDNLSSGVGANEEFVFEVSDASTGARSRCDLASSAASFMDIAEGFLRVLN